MNPICIPFHIILSCLFLASHCLSTSKI